jgi:hypothetical protein
MTPVEQFFYAIEHSWLSQWVTGYAFQWILTVHTLGMGFVAGTSAAVALRLLGVAKGVPVAAMERFYPVIWIAFAANLASGVLLFAGYPYKAATNPVFYVKLALIVLGVTVMMKIRSEVLRRAPADLPRGTPLAQRAKRLAAVSLMCWAGAIVAGRFLAYTYNWLHVGFRGGF